MLDRYNVNDEWYFKDEEEEKMYYNFNGERYSEDQIEELFQEIENEVYERLDYNQVDDYIDDCLETVWLGTHDYRPSYIMKLVDECRYKEYVDEFIVYVIMNEIRSDVEMMDIDESIDTSGISVDTYVSWEV